MRKQERKAARALKLQNKRAEEQKAKTGTDATSADGQDGTTAPAQYEQYLVSCLEFRIRACVCVHSFEFCTLPDDSQLLVIESIEFIVLLFHD